MCGIGGIRRFGKEPIPADALTVMLIGLQNRGTDAAGIAMVNRKGEVAVLKNDTSAWMFTSSKAYTDFLAENLTPETNTVLLHTRAATHGNPRQNENNHPMFFNKCAVVHNGVISNYDSMFKDMKLDKHAETDSDILRAILDKEDLSKKAIRQLARLSGSVACAAISPEQPEHLLLVRSGSPLVTACVGDFFVWASEKKYIHAAMRPMVVKWGIEFQQSSMPNMAFNTMADHSAWLLGPEGLEWHDECKTAYSYRAPVHQVWDNFETRQARWDAEAARARSDAAGKQTQRPRLTSGTIRAKCPKCGKFNKIEVRNYGTDLTEMSCGACKAQLAERK